MTVRQKFNDHVLAIVGFSCQVHCGPFHEVAGPIHQRSPEQGLARAALRFRVRLLLRRLVHELPVLRAEAVQQRRSLQLPERGKGLLAGEWICA